MSKTKAKTASKNNPTTRESAREYLIGGRKIKPVKLITTETSFLSAEYDDTGDLVLGTDNSPVSWKMARNLCS